MADDVECAESSCSELYWLYLMSGILVYLMPGILVYLMSGILVYLMSGILVYLMSGILVYLMSGILVYFRLNGRFSSVVVSLAYFLSISINIFVLSIKPDFI